MQLIRAMDMGLEIYNFYERFSKSCTEASRLFDRAAKDWARLWSFVKGYLFSTPQLIVIQRNIYVVVVFHLSKLTISMTE